MTDPLLEARRTHIAVQWGHPDGLSCEGCHYESGARVLHDECPVINENRCTEELHDSHTRCIKTAGHDGAHLHWRFGATTWWMPEEASAR